MSIPATDRTPAPTVILAVEAPESSAGSLKGSPVVQTPSQPGPPSLPLIDPSTLAESQVARGKKLLEEKKFEDAASAFIQALTIVPGHVEARKYLVNSHNDRMQKTRSQAAEEKYQQGILLQKTRANVEAVFEHFLAAAEDGHAAAQREVGACYSKGIGIKEDANEAFDWFRKAASNGNVTAQVDLGTCYQNGKGASQDFHRAFKCYTKAADQGDPFGQFLLGWCFEHGRGVEQNEQRAIELYNSAAEKGVPAAHTRLGLSCARSKRQNSEREAFSCFQKAAKLGDAEGQYRLAKCYADNGGEKNNAEAVLWYEKASKQGHAEAQCELGKLLTTGKGVKEDKKRAFSLLQTSAAHGITEAEYLVGVYFYRGWEVEKDYKASFQWHYKAACKQHPKSLGYMGSYYETGTGVPQNIPEAIQWYVKGADEGDAFSLMKLGEFCYTGSGIYGVSKDNAKAADFFQRAANKGDDDALYYLAVFHLDGIFAKPDMVQAFNLLKEAIQKGNERAQAKLGVAFARLLKTNPSADLTLGLLG
jgi:TPR repeat protein